jgi:glycosyltransferase involved in cell wall biosynthesis
VAKPEWYGETPWAELHRLLFRKTLRLEDELGSDDVLLMPDFYRDFRTELLPKLIAKTHVQSVAIFHDAAALKLPRLSPEVRTGFCNYLESLAAYRLVICDSRESQDDLLRYWDDQRIRSTATCVEPLPTDFNNTARASNSANGHMMIACIGSFEPRKNHLTLLGAAERLWARGYNFELKFVGRTTA